MYSASEYVFIFLSLRCTPRKAFERAYGDLLGPEMCSVQRKETKASPDIPLIECSCKNTKEKILIFINIQTNGLIGSNEFSVNIDATKFFQGVTISHGHKYIVGCSHPNHFISIEVMTKYDIQDRIKIMSSKDKNS